MSELAHSVSAAFSASLALAGCIGVSQTPYAGAAPALSGSRSASRSASLARCPGLVVPAVDGLIDDFEDGNTQVMTLGERDGYWWLSKDTRGSLVSEPAASFKAAEGGVQGSALAAHVAGHVVVGGDQAWGVELGGNFLSSHDGLYDASRYVGVAFKAKVGTPNSLRSLRVNLPDVNTHQDAGVCKACWNHFRKDVLLTPAWQEYRVLFSEMEQRPGWGDPRPAHVTPSQALALTFAVGGVEADFDVWIDDVEFLACAR